MKNKNGFDEQKFDAVKTVGIRTVAVLEEKKW